MSLTPADLARLAALAALDLPDDQLPALAAQLDRIVTYVGQLAALGDPVPVPEGESAGPGRFRPDEISPLPLAGSLADFAPRFVDGFFVVPRSKGPADE